MRPDSTCFCTNGNGNESDYDAIFKVMIKMRCPTVTVKVDDKRQIISFGAHHTTSYIFNGNDLMDITQSKMPLEEWVMTTFLLSRSDGAVITIYNR